MCVTDYLGLWLVLVYMIIYLFLTIQTIFRVSVRLLENRALRRDPRIISVISMLSGGYYLSLFEFIYAIRSEVTHMTDLIYSYTII